MDLELSESATIGANSLSGVEKIWPWSDESKALSCGLEDWRILRMTDDASSIDGYFSEWID